MASTSEKMHRYGGYNDGSGVVAYAAGASYIKVRFRHSETVYTYSYASAGKQHVENMKILAVAGRGLSTYISRYTHDLFEP